MFFEKHKGFTIIELIVVIAIIAVLAAIVLVNVNQYQAKARDARRVADIKQLQIALQMYYADNGQFYPTAASWKVSNEAGWSNLQTALSNFLKKLPQDPNQSPAVCRPYTTNCYSYGYYTSPMGIGCDSEVAQAYLLVYQLEIASGPDPGGTICGSFYRYGGAGQNTKIKTIIVRADNQ